MFFKTSFHLIIEALVISFINFSKTKEKENIKGSKISENNIKNISLGRENPGGKTKQQYKYSEEGSITLFKLLIEAVADLKRRRGWISVELELCMVVRGGGEFQ